MEIDWNVLINATIPVGAIIGFSLRSLGKKFNKIDERFNKIDCELKEIHIDITKLSDRVSRIEGILTGRPNIQVHGEEI